MSTILGAVSSVLEQLTTRPVHPTLFPYLLAPSLHAVRVSISYQTNVRTAGSSNALSWRTYIAGFLVMAWGGMLTTHALLALPPPALYTFHPYINYLSVHLLTTLFFHLLPSALHPRTLDTLLVPLDAILRANAVASALSLLAPASLGPTSHITLSPLVQSAPLPRLLLGLCAASGGGLVAGTLATWTPDWRPSTPVFLRKEVGLWAATDAWAGIASALVYDLLTANPAYAPLFSSPFLRSLFASPIVRSVLAVLALDTGKPLTHGDARAALTVLLTAVYAGRAWRVHWAPVEDTRRKQVAIKADADEKRI